MKKELFRKGLVLGIIFLFVGVGVIPSLGGTVVEKTTIMDSKSGSYIQDLIDNASDGDTINIPSGTYYENIVINKSINLFGEDKYTTVIDGNYSNDTIYVNANNVKIKNFTIIHGNLYGIRLSYSKDSSIIGNIISNNSYGIYLYESNSNTIKGNNISNNVRGIHLRYSYRNTVQKNNFIDNGKDAFFVSKHIFLLFKRNRWRHNYWDESRLLPELIHGHAAIYFRVGSFGLVIGNIFHSVLIPLIPQIDWFPAKEPYDI